MIKNIHSLLIFNVRQQIRRQKIQNARQIAKDQKFRLWNLFQPDLGLNSIFTFYSDLIALPILKREEAKKRKQIPFSLCDHFPSKTYILFTRLLSVALFSTVWKCSYHWRCELKQIQTARQTTK